MLWGRFSYNGKTSAAKTIVYLINIMWHWDQGHLPYCQFDAVRKIAGFVTTHDFKSASKSDLFIATGLKFASPSTHSPWRQYSRVLKLSLLVTQIGDSAAPTSLAKILAKPGAVTSDEYLHFLVQSFTDPSPALRDWNPHAHFRFPLLFSIKYLLTKCVIQPHISTSLDELITAYENSEMTGEEDQTSFVGLVSSQPKFTGATTNSRRQAKESLQVISQISYFHLNKGEITLSLDSDDAHDIFESLHAIEGKREAEGDAEIARLATLFKDGSTQDFFGYPNTIVTEVVESGFVEGSKVKRTHVVIERNRELRNAFFAQKPSAICDVCSIDTAKSYPWTLGVLDLHHLLPLASGARVVTAANKTTSTSFADLVAVCPSCHRAIHRFYDQWLRDMHQEDFIDVGQASLVYQTVKSTYPGAVYV